MSAFKLETTKKSKEKKYNEVIKGKEEMKSYSGLKLISSTKVFEKFLDICYCTDSKVRSFVEIISTLSILLLNI